MDRLLLHNETSSSDDSSDYMSEKGSNKTLFNSMMTAALKTNQRKHTFPAGTKFIIVSIHKITTYGDYSH